MQKYGIPIAYLLCVRGEKMVVDFGIPKSEYWLILKSVHGKENLHIITVSAKCMN